MPAAPASFFSYAPSLHYGSAQKRNKMPESRKKAGCVSAYPAPVFVKVSRSRQKRKKEVDTYRFIFVYLM